MWRNLEELIVYLSKKISFQTVCFNEFWTMSTSTFNTTLQTLLSKAHCNLC